MPTFLNPLQNPLSTIRLAADPGFNRHDAWAPWLTECSACGERRRWLCEADARAYHRHGCASC